MGAEWLCHRERPGFDPRGPCLHVILMSVARNDDNAKSFRKI